jgi:hypothetical protein
MESSPGGRLYEIVVALASALQQGVACDAIWRCTSRQMVLMMMATIEVGRQTAFCF